LEFSGYKVLREYLHNDVGVQVAKLGESIVNVANGEKLADQEYKGEYILALAKQIRNSKFEIRNSSEAGKIAVEILLKDILKDAEDMGTKFDKVYPESEFATTDATEKVLKTLKEKGFLKEKEGALWFAPNDRFLADRECVVKKSDGNYTYFANDIAYHNLKFVEGYDLVIDILGANHHGHVPRLKAAVDALGFDSSKFHVILYQWVRFKSGTETIKMAKRAGTFVTAREVLKEVGRDAVRFFILSHDANSHIDFDLDLAREKSAKNPVYYVQYAHARIASILRRANSKLQAPRLPKTGTVGQANSKLQR
jgi:arginyl-tRNA synthetase